MIDANHYPIPHIEKMTLGNRKIGLGIMGFADAPILMGIRYGSEEAAELADRLASFIQEHAHQASEELAEERGCFPQRLIERVKSREYNPTNCKTIWNNGFRCPRLGRCQVKAPMYLSDLPGIATVDLE